MPFNESSSDIVLNQIAMRVGPPVYRRPGVSIYHADSLEFLRRLEGELFALTVTSPPYNIGKAYETPLPINNYIDWCSKWIQEIYRLTRQNGAFWLNLGYLEVSGRAKAIPIPYLIWEHVPFYLLQEIVWNYAAGVASKKSFSPRNEKFLWYIKNSADYTFNLDDIRDPNVKYPNQKKNGILKCNPLGKNPSDVWQFPKVTSGTDRSSPERTPHPAQFPIVVIERIIRACSNPGDLVVDPFLGSGTVADVAIRHGRPVLGIEIQRSYVDIAIGRIEQTIDEIRLDKSQGKLFSLVQR